MKYIYFLPILILIISCENTPQQAKFERTTFKDAKADKILTDAFDYLGGEENWDKLAWFSFYKYTLKHDSLGNEIENTLHKNRIQFHPEKVIEISWTDSLGNHILTKNKSGITKQLNGSNVTDFDKEKMNNWLITSDFVVNIPFKLRDKGVSINFDSSTDSQNIVTAVYNADKNESHSKSDKYWYYFNKETNQFDTYLIDHGHWSRIDNIEYISKPPFKFISKRKGYRSNEKGEKVQALSEYHYKNWRFALKK